MLIMKITKELLLERGYEERVIEGHYVFVKNHIALFYDLNVWRPCHYSYGTILTDRLYINTMEELDILSNN